MIRVVEGGNYNPVIQGLAPGIASALFIEVIDRENGSVLNARTNTGVVAIAGVPGGYQMTTALTAPALSVRGLVIWDTAASAEERTPDDTWTEEVESFAIRAPVTSSSPSRRPSPDPFITPAMVSGSFQNPMQVAGVSVEDFVQMVVNEIVRRGYIRVLNDVLDGPYAEIPD